MKKQGCNRRSAEWTTFFKNIFALTAVVLALVPWDSSANDFKLSKDGKTLLKYQGNATEVTIPEGVTKIGMRSLWRNNNIERVVIPDGVTEIAQGALAHCKNLKEVNIPDSVTKIGSSAFSNCPELSQITIPYGITKIERSTFESCKKLPSINIPDSVTEIHAFAFLSCDNLKKTIIPAGVRFIGGGAFTGVQSIQVSKQNQNYYTDGFGALINRNERRLLYCPPSLIKYRIPGNVTSIDANAFSIYKNFKLQELIIPQKVSNISDSLGYTKSVKLLPGNKWYYTDAKGVLFNKRSKTLVFAPAYLKEYTVPDGTVKIGSMAFLSCENLSSITIPDSVKRIGYHAFMYCQKLTEITVSSQTEIFAGAIPRNCKVIRKGSDKNRSSNPGRNAYRKNSGSSSTTRRTAAASSMQEFELSDNNQTLIKYRGNASEVVIPQGVTKIGRQAFYFKRNLRSVTIPDGVTEIGESAFGNCTNLQQVKIPDSVAEIGTAAFTNCRNLKQVNIPKSLTKIKYGVFHGCSSLSNITIPEHVTSIETLAFRGCKFKSLFIHAAVSKIGGGSFAGTQEVKVAKENPHYYTDSNGLLIERKKSTLIYCPPSVFSCTVPDYIKELRYYAFYDCVNLEAITIPETVTNITPLAFRECPKLTDLSISPDNPRYYSDAQGAIFDKKEKAIIYCPPSVEKFYIPEHIRIIPSNAFFGCKKLTGITIPDGVVSVASGAFSDCKNLKKASVSRKTRTQRYSFPATCKVIVR